MQFTWSDIFDNFGIKVVSATDKSRSAYVLNAAQLGAVEAAGLAPAAARPAPGFKLNLLFDAMPQVEASFYMSNRSSAAAREPEPRMGHAFISSWAEVGDEIVVGNIGRKLYAAKISSTVGQDLGPVLAKARGANRNTIIRKGKAARGKPKRTTRTVRDFVRDPYVVAAARIRAERCCEMPDCETRLFTQEDGTAFLEVHHIVLLSEGGVDELLNAAALCPMCHRELHHGKRRLTKRARLRAAILAKPF